MPRSRDWMPTVGGWLAGLALLLAPPGTGYLQGACPNLAPAFTVPAQVQVISPGTPITPREANLAVNTDAPEVLFTFLGLSETPHLDPITGQPAYWGVFGRFFNPLTAEPQGDPFLIVGNPHGNGERHDVKYNPVSRQYVVAVSARFYPPNNAQLVLMAWVHSLAANPSNRIARAFVHEPQSTASFQDVALAVSTNNGNCLLVTEYKIPGEGEAVVGSLFGPQGDLLTTNLARLGLLQPAGDEDDPDVVYLPRQDVFLQVVNTDFVDGLRNRVTGLVVETAPDATGQLRTGLPQVLTASPSGWEGHPAALENPFTGDILTAFDLGGNEVPDGMLAFHRLGPGPAYALTAARPEIPYLSSSQGILLYHNHPQMAADPERGVIAVVYSSFQGPLLPDALRFKLLGPAGVPLPGQPPEGHLLVPTGAPLFPTDPNHYNVKFDPFSRAFIAVYNPPNNGTVGAAWLRVQSTHHRPALCLQRATNELGVPAFEVSWPDGYDDFRLEAATSLTAMDWAPVNTPPVLRNGLKCVRLEWGAARQFFRLATLPQ